MLALFAETQGSLSLGLLAGANDQDAYGTQEGNGPAAGPQGFMFPLHPRAFLSPAAAG